MARPGSLDNAANEIILSGDTTGQDIELGAILEAIALDVARMSAAACDAVTTEYDSAIRNALRHLPKHLVAGTVRGFKDAINAALAAIKKAATTELASRREAAIRAHRGHFRPVSSKPPDAPNLK